VSPPLWARVLLIQPSRIQANLERVRRAGLVERTPNLWQLGLGVLRMWHRLVFRSETIGTCAAHPVRPTLRARLLQYRPLRFPFLVAERAIAPLDLTGLASSPERLVRHLLGAHHDGEQFVFDLEILSCYPGKLEELAAEVRALIARDSARSRWLRDLTVYERYHENLAAAVERALTGDLSLPPEQADDPDISFAAYLRWCAAQPETPAATWQAWRRGQLTLEAA
jgi:hypothetical protein